MRAPYLVTKTGWLMAQEIRGILWRIACAERRGHPWDAMQSTDPDDMDALERAGLVEGTGEVGYYRLTDAGRRELPQESSGSREGRDG